jgi:nucleotide-binding universal stress UspA family protein
VSWQTIVLGFDDTPAARRALRRTAELAKAFGADVVVTSVAHALPSGAASHGLGPADPADSPELHRDELEDARAFLDIRGIAATLELAVGDPADEIVKVARRHDADLIVVGTREPGFLERLLSGSVSQAVSRHARCDVLIVH